MKLQLRNDFRWHVKPEFRASIDEVSAAIAAGHAQVVKQGRLRTVYRVHSPNLDVYLKHCRPVGWRAWLRECFRPAKAILEFRKLGTAAANNVPTVSALACAKRNRFLPGESILVTRAIPGAVPCGQYQEQTLPNLPEPVRRRKRQALAKSLGRFLADLHRAGVVHPDLHPDNLLLSYQHEAPVFYILDVHDVQTGVPCGMRASLKNLAVFNRWFVLRASRSDRLRFWKAYTARRRELDGQEWPPEKCRDLEAMTRASNFRLWRSWAKRCFGNNRRFAKVRDHKVMGHAITEVTTGQLQPLLADPDAPFRQASALLKSSRSSAVAEIAFSCRVGGAQRNPPACSGGLRCAPPTLPSCIYKCFRASSLWQFFSNLFRRSACLRSWQNGHAFRDCLLPTPRPLAVWHRLRFGLLREGYLLTERITNAEDLHQFLSRVQALPNAERIGLLRQALDQLGRQIRQLHESGWAHRDLKATNILIQMHPESARNESAAPHPRPLSPAERGGIWFIDLVGAWRPWRLWESRRHKDLSRLNASFHASVHLSRTDRLRFLRAYMNWNLHGQ